jgi:phosphoribosyl-ATP pyrophosphohydrolase
MAGYHITYIKKGKLGAFSKVEEEFYEFVDSQNQDAKIMGLIELSDLIGALHIYLAKHFDLDLHKQVLPKIKLKTEEKSEGKHKNHQYLYLQIANSFDSLKEKINVNTLDFFEVREFTQQEIEDKFKLLQKPLYIFLFSVAYYLSHFNLTFKDISTMSNITQRAFESGSRVSSEE